MSEGKIYKMFFDPTGRHLIITTETGDNYYLFAKWKKAKLLSKIKVRKHRITYLIPDSMCEQ